MKICLSILFHIFLFAGCTTTKNFMMATEEHSNYLELGERIPIAIVGINIIPMNIDGVLKDRVVLISKGRIEKILHRREINGSELKEQYRIIDGTNKYLIPGLIDAHVHLGNMTNLSESYSELPLFVANGVTTIRNMAGAPLTLKIRRKIESGHLAGPRIFSTGPIYNGASAYSGKNNSDWCFRDSKPNKCALKTSGFAVSRVQQDKKLGYDAIKAREFLSRKVYLSLYREALKEGLPIMGHYPSAIGYEEMFSKKYQHSIDHMSWAGRFVKTEKFPFKGGKMDEMAFGYVGLHHLYPDKKKEKIFLKAFANSGIYFVPTLSLGMNNESEVRNGGVSPEEKIDFYSKCKLAWLSAANSYYKKLQKWLDYDGKNLIRDGYKAKRKFIYDAWKAGVRIVTGTDTNSGVVISGFSMHDEMGELTRAGIPTQEVLRAATKNAAALLKNSDIGIVQQGAIADLVILDENPLNDIAATRKINGVFLKGSYYEKKELQKALNKVKMDTASIKCEEP